jgi:superoxide oxidase
MNALIKVPAPARPGAPVRFDGVSIGLHWATVILIVAMFASAWSIGLAGDAAARLTLHRSTGVILWFLAIARLAWRLRFAGRPPLPAHLPAVQRLAATLVEGALYVLLLTQPLTGLAQTLARGKPFQLFVFQAPALLARDKPMTRLFHETHELSAWVLLGLIGVHIAAALFHRFGLRDRVLQSMWPGRRA